MDAAINYTANAPVNPLGYGDIIIVKPGDLHPAFDLRYDTITHLQIKPRLDGVEWGQTGIYSVYCPEVAPKNDTLAAYLRPLLQSLHMLIKLQNIILHLLSLFLKIHSELKESIGMNCFCTNANLLYTTGPMVQKQNRISSV